MRARIWMASCISLALGCASGGLDEELADDVPADSDVDVDSDTDTDADAEPDSDTDAELEADAGPDSDSDSDADGDADADGDSDGDSDADVEEPGCEPGLDACDGECVDLETDARHCGECGNACITCGETCTDGVCGPDGSGDCSFDWQCGEGCRCVRSLPCGVCRCAG